MISTSNLSLRLSRIPPEEVDRNHHHPSSSSSPLSASVVAGEEDGVDDRDYPNDEYGFDEGNDVLGDSAPPEWALLLIGCVIGVAAGICIAGFNKGVHVIHEWSWAGTPNEGASWLRLQRLADTWHQILLIPVTGDHGTSMESIQYLQDVRYSLRVAKRNPGWEYLQDALFSIDPVRAQEDPVIVKNVPFYKAKKALEAEVTKLNPPPRPQNWGRISKTLQLYEKTVLLNAQREIADKILDAQWEAKWRQEKVNQKDNIFDTIVYIRDSKWVTRFIILLIGAYRKLLSSLPMKAKESYAGGSGGITGETGLVISRDASFVEKCHVLS
ncbi:hypothetical protein Bca4012_064450 [Brassica carinata]